MRRLLTRRRRLASLDERGAVAVMTALMVTVLLVAVGMALDFGLVRTDRQIDKSAADAAAAAGLGGLNGGNGNPYPYRGVCTAIRYLQANAPRFAGVDDTSGTWTTATGSPSANGCTDSTVRGQACTSNPSSWARYTWNGTWKGAPLQVVIQSGYRIDTATGYSEETLPAVQADNLDSALGCDQLSVIIKQNRKPGFGRKATSADLVSTIRTVGRIKLGPGGYAPAMLLLKRTGCTSLEVGSNAGSSWVKVFGSITPGGVSQPGTIHADANGQSCSSSVYYGKANNGIIAYAAPLPSGLADPSKPGEITSVAGMSGLATAYDGISNVYGSSLLSGTGSPKAPSGRELVTRKPVDDRYLAGVTTAISGAQGSVFGSGLNASNAVLTYGYTASVTCPSSGPDKGKITMLPALDSNKSLYVDCSLLQGSIPINAGTVVFNGAIAPDTGQVIELPNAHHVYVYGTSGNAVDLTNGALKVHTAGNLDAGTCTNQPGASRKAVMFVRNGSFNEANSGSLQMCNVSLLMMGGRGDACLPAAYTDIVNAPLPTQTPCAGVSSGMGNGQFKQTGGDVDWTAPNVLSDTIDANGDPTPAALTAWSDPNGPEDLALWDESAGNSSSTKYQFTGGGGFHLQGIFMVPNADPISLSGSANFDLNNAQFVATSLALASNNTTLSMRVDPNSAVTLPKLKTVGLVR